jgi:trk system potassium uptake protein TrkH
MSLSVNVLYRSESSPWAIHEFRTNAHQSVRILLIVYLGLAILQTAALLFCGIGLFDSVTTAFGTVATGGFSPRQLSIASYESLPVELVTIFFMVVSGMHFGLLFQAVRGRWDGLLRAPAARWYLAFLSVGTLLATASVYGENYPDWLSALRYAAFQVVSVGTSTGFANADSSVWPPLAQLVLIFLTLQCACSGSTSGGIKVDRVVVFLKAAAARLKEVANPRAVFAVRIGDSVVSDSTVKLSVVYIVIYLGVVFVSSVLLTASGVGLLEAFTGSAAAMGNVGPGLGTVGSMGSFSDLPAAGKWVLSGTMLLGRLEIFGLIVCLSRNFWR